MATFLEFTDAGSGFVYGYLVDQTPFNLGVYGNNRSGDAYNIMEEINNGTLVDGVAQKPLKFIFMFKILSVIFFFSFIVSMLFHLGAMQCKNILRNINLILQFRTFFV